MPFTCIVFTDVWLWDTLVLCCILMSATLKTILNDSVIVNVGWMLPTYYLCWVAVANWVENEVRWTKLPAIVDYGEGCHTFGAQLWRMTPKHSKPRCHTLGAQLWRMTQKHSKPMCHTFGAQLRRMTQKHSKPRCHTFGAQLRRMTQKHSKPRCHTVDAQLWRTTQKHSKPRCHTFGVQLWMTTQKHSKPRCHTFGVQLWMTTQKHSKPRCHTFGAQLWRTTPEHFKLKLWKLCTSPLCWRERKGTLMRYLVMSRPAMSSRRVRWGREKPS